MTKELKDESGKRVHPYIPELCDQLRQKKIGRRDFLYTATMLGVSAGAAYAQCHSFVRLKTPSLGGR